MKTTVTDPQFNQKFPKHIAIIMDGNGRWAAKKGLPTIAGHKAGAEALKKICRGAADIGITHITTFAFSTENWQRPQSWVAELMDLLKYYLKYELKDLIKNNIQLHVIGDRSLISDEINKIIDVSIKKTQKNTGLNLIIALSYGGRSELVHVVQEIVKAIDRNEVLTENINEAEIEKHLYTSKFPSPDLLIRTSGEMRISNFLLWQIAYTELYFTGKLWPEFEIDDLKLAISDYQNRERRYGAVVSK